jgi:hypothetical protein
MTDEMERTPEPPYRRRWYLWILFGTLLGTIFGPMGAAVGGATETLITFVVNCVPGARREGFSATCLILGLGTITGTLIGFAPWNPPKDSLAAMLGGGAATLIGAGMAIVDRMFVWVAFPEGAEPPPDLVDDPDVDLKTDDGSPIGAELED